MALPTGVPHSYKNASPQDPTVALCIGAYGGPWGGGGVLMSEAPLYTYTALFGAAEDPTVD